MIQTNDHNYVSLASTTQHSTHNTTNIMQTNALDSILYIWYNCTTTVLARLTTVEQQKWVEPHSHTRLGQGAKPPPNPYYHTPWKRFPKAQIPLRRLSPKLPHEESRGHKSWKSRTQTISTCQDFCDKVCDKSATNPFLLL